MREAGYAPKEERMIRLIAAAAAGILIAAVGAYVVKNLVSPGTGSAAAVTTYDGN
jgi:hypothetical protein